MITKPSILYNPENSSLNNAVQNAAIKMLTKELLTDHLYAVFS